MIFACLTRSPQSPPQSILLSLSLRASAPTLPRPLHRGPSLFTAAAEKYFLTLLCYCMQVEDFNPVVGPVWVGDRKFKGQEMKL